MFVPPEYFPINNLQEEKEGWSENLGKLTAIGAGATGLFASGFIRTEKGRMFDKYLEAIRSAETGFPSAILRTFRVSEFLSPLETWNDININEKILKGAGVYRDYLSRTFGETNGISLKRTGSVFGGVYDESGKHIGYGLRIKAGSQKGAAIADYYARLKGLQLTSNQSLNESLLRSYWRDIDPGIGFYDWLNTLGPEIKRQDLILGAKLRKKLQVGKLSLDLSESLSHKVAKAEVGINLFRAKAASTAGRLNTLLTAPFDIPYLGDVLARIPGVRSMSVLPGSNTEILMRLTKKGIAAGLVWKGFEYLDYLRSEDSMWSPVIGIAAGAAAGNIIAKQPGKLFSKAGLVAGALFGASTAISERFNEGYFAGLLSVGTDINVHRAEFSQSFGLTEALQEQEELTPGLTKLSTGLAFGGIGALATGLASYGSYLKEAITERKQYSTFSQALEAIRESRSNTFLNDFWSSATGKKIGKLPLLSSLKNIKSPMAMGFLGGMAAWGIAKTSLSLMSGNFLASLPGSSILGTTETPEELQAIYSGEQEIAVRKGRWWEFGRSSKYEGGRIEYFRQHMLPRLRSRAYQKGLYGDESEKWEYDPILHPLDFLTGGDEFKYHYEEKYQYERPGTLTAPYGYDIPFIGPLFAATFGKLIKPRKLVRPNEWIDEEGNLVHRPDPRGEREPAEGLDGLPPEEVVSPDNLKQLFNELNYRRREAVGLVGFMEGSITKGLIGREEIFENQPTFSQMGKEAGSEYWLWKHLNLGGAAGTSEPVRRFIPRTRSYLDTYNPLKNALPSWVPEDYFLDLKYGNPFEKIPEAEIRLPGPGLAALYPELKGVDPEEYSIPWRVKVLGDIAFWSKEYKQYMSLAKRNFDEYSAREQAIILQTEEQVKAKKVRKEFSNYRFNEDLLDESRVTIKKALSSRRFLTEEYGDLILEAQGVGRLKDNSLANELMQELEGQQITIYKPKLEDRAMSLVTAGGRMKVVPFIGEQDLGTYLSSQGATEEASLQGEFEQLRYSNRERLVGQLSETLLHGIETPLETLTPMSPAAKLIRQRSPLEDYIKEVAIGTGNAFWDKPVENFFAPFYELTKEKLGLGEIPEHIKENRAIEEYFDMLKWIKYSRLEQKARNTDNLTLATEFKKTKESTTFGTDVFKNPSSILTSLPRRDRNYFKEFVNLQTEEDRERLLELIPENQQRIYLSLWARQSEQAALVRQKGNIATSEDQETIDMVSRLRRGEGYQYTDDQLVQWEAETDRQISFDDWLREQKAEEYFATHSLPDSSWIGFNPAIDLEDIALKYVEMAGKDHFDFDIWQNRKKGLLRKPYINTDLIEDMLSSSDYVDSWIVARNSKTLAEMYGDYEAKLSQTTIAADLGPNRYNIEISDGRKDLLEKAYREMGI